MTYSFYNILLKNQKNLIATVSLLFNVLKQQRQNPDEILNKHSIFQKKKINFFNEEKCILKYNYK